MVDLAFFLYLIAMAPKLLVDRLKGKRHPDFLQRLGARIPDPKKRPVIWIHAVSVGEAKAAQPLFRALQREYPETFFLITTTTAAGQEEAKRSLSGAGAYRYLPLDFTWIVRRWAKALPPQYLLLIEGDLWPNLLAAVKKAGGKNILISGKISPRSARRFQILSPLSRKLFSRLDLLCVQNEEHADRFRPLVPDPSRIHITGNLKLDIEPQKVDIAHWRSLFPGNSLTLSCTHAPEEDLLLDALKDGPWTLFLAPRHPERFDEVAQIILKKNLPYIRWSQLDKRRGGERVILVDAMGQLPICYSLSRLAIVAGSFTPKVGGHNVFEPCLYGCPSLFGPYTQTQREFVQRVLEAGAGRQLSLEDLSKAAAQILDNPLEERALRSGAMTLIAAGRGAVERTLTYFRKDEEKSSS